MGQKLPERTRIWRSFLFFASSHLSLLLSLPPSLQADYIGLDTCLYILEGWVKKYPNEPAFIVPSSLRALVKEGKLGRKSGEGFYVWQGDKKIKSAM